MGTPLFPGKENEPHNPKAFQENQLRTIFSILGSLTPEHWNAVRSLPDWPKIENWAYESYSLSLSLSLEHTLNTLLISLFKLDQFFLSILEFINGDFVKWYLT
jgi:hypothetical protein